MATMLVSAPVCSAAQALLSLSLFTKVFGLGSKCVSLSTQAVWHISKPSVCCHCCHDLSPRWQCGSETKASAPSGTAVCCWESYSRGLVSVLSTLSSRTRSHCKGGSSSPLAALCAPPEQREAICEQLEPFESFQSVEGKVCQGERPAACCSRHGGARGCGPDARAARHCCQAW